VYIYMFTPFEGIRGRSYEQTRDRYLRDIFRRLFFFWPRRKSWCVRILFRIRFRDRKRIVRLNFVLKNFSREFQSYPSDENDSEIPPRDIFIRRSIFRYFRRVREDAHFKCVGLFGSTPFVLSRGRKRVFTKTDCY